MLKTMLLPPSFLASFLAIAALQEQGICAVVKHFPGHGRTKGDSHFGKQSLDVDWKSLLLSDIVPFRESIQAGVDAMMTAHIEFPRIDPTGFPVSMSPVLIQQKLRRELGFNGLIITDALDMQGILNSGGPEAVGRASIQAGVDMLLCPENALQIRNALLSAVNNKTMSSGRIKESFQRIISIKNRAGILGSTINLIDSEALVLRIGSAKHQKLMADSFN